MAADCGGRFTLIPKEIILKNFGAQFTLIPQNTKKKMFKNVFYFIRMKWKSSAVIVVIQGIYNGAELNGIVHI